MMARIQYYIVAGVFCSLCFLYGSCNSPKDFDHITVADLAKFSLPDVEQNAIEQNKVFKIILADSTGRELGYSEYDRFGRLTCSVASGVFSSSRCYRYNQASWPTQETERSDTGPQVTIIQYLLFPASRRLYALKTTGKQNYLTESVCYSFNKSNQLQKAMTIDFIKQDSIVTEYAYQGDLLKTERTSVFAIPKGIANEEMKEGLLETQEIRSYCYSGASKLDSVTKVFTYQDLKQKRKIIQLYDPFGLRKALLVIRPENHIFLSYHVLKLN